MVTPASPRLRMAARQPCPVAVYGRQRSVTPQFGGKPDRIESPGGLHDEIADVL
jgi:hypothetical protein